MSKQVKLTWHCPIVAVKKRKVSPKTCETCTHVSSIGWKGKFEFLLAVVPPPRHRPAHSLCVYLSACVCVCVWRGGEGERILQRSLSAACRSCDHGSGLTVCGSSCGQSLKFCDSLCYIQVERVEGVCEWSVEFSHNCVDGVAHPKRVQLTVNSSN